MIDAISIQLRDQQKTASFGHSLASTIYSVPVWISLNGELGAGKTTLVQGLAAGLGITTPVTSPTFALEQRHKTAKKTGFLHIDLYRLEPKEAASLLASTDDYPGIRCIEWTDRLPPDSPFRPDIRIRLEEDGEGRNVEVLFEDLAMPSRERILEWREEVLLPEHIARHCDAVAAFSSVLAKHLLEQGVAVRPLALLRAAEVHDLLRFVDFKPGAGPDTSMPEQRAVWETWRRQWPDMRHESACAAFLRERGFPGLAEIVIAHGLALPSPQRVTTEQRLLYYADKRVMVDHVVSLDERFADFDLRYNAGESNERGRMWLQEAKEVETMFFPEGPPV